LVFKAYEEKMKFKFIIFIISFLMINSKLCFSQEIDLIRIVAIVNDEPITAIDLNDRLQLTIVTSNLPNNSKTRQNLSGQVLQNLINERLQEQEANKLNIKISEEEIIGNIKFIEQRNNLNEGELETSLQKQGVSINALKKNIKANLINQKLLQQIIKPKIIINNDEVNNEYKNIILNEGKTEFKLSEILLNYNDISSKEEILSIAQELRKQIIETNDFEKIASQINRSRAGKFIKNNDWIIETNINNDLLKNLNEINTNEITKPIITNSGISIYRLDGKRINSIPNLSESVVNIGFISYDLPINMNRINEILSEINNEIQVITSCEKMKKESTKIGNKKGNIIGRTILNNLPEDFIKSLSNLKPKTLSKPIIANDGIYILMICEINKELNQEFALKEIVKKKIENRSTTTLQHRYLLDLNRRALIDIRL
tara:strand:+ start:8817 stop:10106 length:1290 start_codon:yes stop_codon:yes gene_type:complete